VRGIASKLAKTLLLLVFVASPAVATFIALQRMHAGFPNCVPIWNDEAIYWNEIACFTRAGYSAGYCVVDEDPARASWTHFGTHGPGYPTIYGLLGKAFGWTPNRAPIFNLVLVAAASLLWALVVRPSKTQLAVAAALLGSFWPLILYLPCTMQEALHCSFAILLAGLVTRVFQGHNGYTVVAMLGIVAAAITKFSWALVLLPLLIAALPGRSWLTKSGILLVTLAGLPAAVWLFGEICAPYPERLNTDVAFMRSNPLLELWTLEMRWERGWKAFILTSEPGISIVQRVELVMLTLLALGSLLARRHAKQAVFAVANVFVPLVMTMLVFDMGGFRDYRVVAPHLLLSLLVLLMVDWRMVTPFVVANVVCVGIFFSAFEDFHQERLAINRDAIEATRQELSQYIQFHPAEDGWSNTLLYPMFYPQHGLCALPRGIGLTLSLSNCQGLQTIKSRYVILTWGSKPPPQLELLADTSLGPLYRNVDPASGPRRP
jgi:hypothetical protein